MSNDPFTRGVESGFGRSFEVVSPAQGNLERQVLRETQGEAFELAFGFIPTFNVGTALGVRDPVTRIAMDILLDPINLALSFVTGGLTMAGKAAAASSKLAKMPGQIAKLGGLNAVQRADEIEKIYKMADVARKEPELIKKLTSAVKANDVKATKNAIGEIGKRVKSGALDRKDLEGLPLFMGRDELLTLMKVEDRARKSNMVLDTSEGAIKAFDKSRVSQLKAGQRRLVGVKVPFTAIEKTLIEGNKVYSKLDEWRPFGEIIAKGEGKGMRIREGIGALWKTRSEDSATEFNRARDLRNKVMKKVEVLAPGALSQGFGTLATFVREGAGVPVSVVKKLGLEKDFAHMTAKDGVYSHIALTRYIQKKGWGDAMKYSQGHIDSMHKSLLNMVNESGIGKEIPEIESYIAHIYDWDQGSIDKMRQIAGRLAKTGFMEKKRKVGNYTEAIIKHELKPRTLDAFELTELYHQSAARIVHNNLFFNSLRDTRVMISGKQRKLVLTAKGVKKMEPEDLANYVKVEDQRLLRKITGQKGTIKPRWVHKDVAKMSDVIAGDPFGGLAGKFPKFARAIDRFNATSKVMSLGASFFHSAALTETAFAVGGIGAKEAVKAIGRGDVTGAGRAVAESGFGRAARRGFGILGLNQLSSKMGKAGLPKGMKEFTEAQIKEAARYINVDVVSDVRIEDLNKAMDSIVSVTERIPGGSLLGKLPKKFADAQNNALWNNFHSPMKVWAFHKKKAEMLSDPRFFGMSEQEISRQVGRFIDDAFGGQQWEKLMVSPQMKRSLHWLMFAPDWTLSNIRVFSDLGGNSPKNIARAFLGEPVESEKVVGLAARQYWANAAFGFGASTALWNRALSGRWNWENPSDKVWDIATGTVDDKGREEYFKLGKQLREPLRWMTDPLSIGGPKMSPGLREVFEQLTAHSTTGFPTDFAHKPGTLPMAFHETLPARLKNVSEKFVPFSFQGNNYWFTFPKSSYSETSAAKTIMDELKVGTKNGVLQLLRHSAANGHDINRIKGKITRKLEGNHPWLNQEVN